MASRNHDLAARTKSLQPRIRRRAAAVKPAITVVRCGAYLKKILDFSTAALDFYSGAFPAYTISWII
jgi:hypothetical protein